MKNVFKFGFFVILALVVIPVVISLISPTDEKTENCDCENVVYTSRWDIYRGNCFLNGLSPAKISTNITLLWEKQIDGEILSSPVVDEKSVYISSLNSNVFVLNRQNGSLRYKVRVKHAVESSVLLHKNRMYFSTREGMLYCVSTTDGEILWNKEGYGKISGSANIVPEKNLLVVGSYDSYMYGINSENGDTLWKIKSGSYINGSAAVTKDYLAFGGCDSFIRILDFEGELKYSHNVGSYIPSSVAFSGESIFALTYEGYIVRVGIRGGLIWKSRVSNAEFLSSPAVDEKSVYAASRDYRLYCLNRENGKVRWSFNAKSIIDADAVIMGNYVVVCAYNSILYLLDKDTGLEVFSYILSGPISAAPACPNEIFVATEKGTIYALGEKK